MKRILVIGAGRSARILIDYLLDNSSVHNWNVTIADYSKDLAKRIQLIIVKMDLLYYLMLMMKNNDN